MDETHFERFMTYIDAQPNGCWMWTGHTNADGYGGFNVHRKHRLAHRVSYVHFIADIPKATEIDHLCRNRACVNPTHLEAVQHHENILRGELGTLRTKALNRRLAAAWTPERKAMMAEKREQYYKSVFWARSHCLHGHELTGDNVVITGRQHRCRECQRAANRICAAKRRARQKG